MKLTRGKIAHNLKESPYEKIVTYEDGEFLVFKFSSPKYIEKFNHRVYDNRKKINESLSNRFGFEIENNKLCDIKLYMTLEIRGFYIECKEGVVEWPSNIKLNGENRIQKK